MSTNHLFCFNHNDISRIFFRTFFLPISTCSGTSSGKGSSKHHQVRRDRLVLKAERCSRWVQAWVEQVDQHEVQQVDHQVDP